MLESLGVKLEGVAKAKNSDIIKGMVKYWPMAKEQTRSIARKFHGRTDLDTVTNVYDYLRSLDYKADGFKQVLKLPRSLADTKTGDCKSYTMLAGGVLSNLGFNVQYKYISGDPESSVPNHVYLIARKNGKAYVVDGTNPKFLKEFPYAKQKTMTMEYEAITGYDQSGEYEYEYDAITGKRRRRRKARRKRRRKRRRKFFKKIGRGIQKVVKTGFKGLAKFNPVLAAARLAMLTLVKSNARGIATKMHKANQKTVEKVWRTAGGKWNTLRKAIRKGRSKGITGVMAPGGICYYDAQSNPDEFRMRYLDYDDPRMNGLPAVGILISKAWGILQKLMPFLKEVEGQVKGAPPIEQDLQAAAENMPNDAKLSYEQFNESFNNFERTGIPQNMGQVPSPQYLNKPPIIEDDIEPESGGGAAALLPLAALMMLGK